MICNMVASILSLAELRKLIRSRSNTKDTVNKCVCMIDLFYEVEKVKKRNMGSKLWNSIRRNDSNLHYRVSTGNIVTLDLDHSSLEQGLFEMSDDHKSLCLWEPAAKTTIPPEDSVRLVSLRYFDICYGTDLCDSALTTFYD